MMGCWCTNTNPLHGSQQSAPLVFLPGSIPLDFYSILLTMITFAFGRVPLISDSSYLKSLTHDNFFHIIIMVVDFFCINFDFSFLWFFFVLGQCDSFFPEVVKTLGLMLLSSLRNHDSYTLSLNKMFPNFINFISIGPISPFLVFVNTNYASYIKLIYLKNSL